MLPCCKGLRLIVSIPIASSMVQIFHQLGGGVSQAQGYCSSAVLFHKLLGRLESFVNRIGFGRDTQVHHTLSHGQFSLRRAQPLHGLHGIQGHAEGPWIGETNVLAGHSDHSPGYVFGIHATIQHANHPVQCCIRIRTSNGLVQCADGVIKLLSAFVVPAKLFA